VSPLDIPLTILHTKKNTRLIVSTEDTISVFHWNSRSIRHKLDHLQTINNDSSIICVTESHLDENILTTDIKLPGYHEPFRNDRNCFGGGVLVYTADYLHVLRRNDLEFNGGELI
jgi:hypothetical protein